MNPKSSSPKRSNPPRKSSDIPITIKMLKEARFELKHEINSLRYEMKAEFKGARAGTAKVQANLHQLQTNFDMLQANFDQLQANFENGQSNLLSAVHRVGLLVEEQNAKNNYVLDGYASLSDRIDKIEKQIKDV